MSPPAEDSAAFEERARAVALAWMTLDHRTAWPLDPAELAPICQGDPRLQALSRAFEALLLATIYRLGPAAAQGVASALAFSRQLGWPRATRLAEAAQALVMIYQPETHAASLEVLLGHGPAEEDGRPAIERLWTDTLLCNLMVLQGDYDAALGHGVRADRQAQATGLDFPIGQAGNHLAYVFLSVGDLEGASAVLPRVMASVRRCGLPDQGSVYNLLLCHVLSGRTEEACALLDPYLQRPDQQQPGVRRPALECLVAKIWCDSGRTQEALALLDALGDSRRDPSPAMATNQVWLAASVRLALGQAAMARAALEGYLQEVAASGQVLSPLNRAQLERVLCQCCESLGDWPGALAALKRSQLSHYRWVAESVRSRLQAMHLDQASADAGRHDRRLQEVEEAVRQARQAQEQEMNARQSRYLAHVTHEMRNPLNGLIGMTSLLAMSELNERQRRFLGLAQSSAQMLLALCNDVLDLAKIDAGRFELNPQPNDVAALLGETVELFSPQVTAKGLSLELQVSPTLPPRLVVDRLRMQQLLMNLIGNAAKFTRQGGIRVVVQWQATHQEAGQIHVAVVDTGPGLNAEQRARLFQEFSQADASVAQQHGGTGLGLALCRSLVTLMGGTIGLDSEPGQGSTFWFEVPLNTVGAPLVVG